MTAPDRGLLGSALAVGIDPGAALRAARKEAGLTVEQLADRVEEVRRRRCLREVQHESVRRQLIGFESGDHQPGDQWRQLIAAALQIPHDRLFGPSAPRALPSPMLASMHVTEATVQILHAHGCHRTGRLPRGTRSCYRQAALINGRHYIRSNLVTESRRASSPART